MCTRLGPLCMCLGMNLFRGHSHGLVPFLGCQLFFQRSKLFQCVANAWPGCLLLRSAWQSFIWPGAQYAALWWSRRSGEPSWCATVEASSVGPRQVHHSPLRILISWCWQRQSDFVDLLSHLWSKRQTKWLNDNNILNAVFNIMIKGSLGGETSVLRTFRMSGKELVKERVSKERVRQGKS